MRKIYALPVFLIGWFGILMAQQPDAGPVKTPMRLAPIGSVNIRTDVKMDFQPSYEHLEMPMPGSKRHAYDMMKREIAENPPVANPAVAKASATAGKPNVLRNFVGNNYNNRIPNDNDVAISNDGKLVSVINSTIWAWDVNADSIIYNIGLEGFSTSLGIPNDKFDPRVMYDPDFDRFVVAFLRGFTDTTSYIMLAFSQTNDPSGTWNFYALDGAPFPDSSWTDFPMMALTQDEFFITGNLIGTGEPWETGFRQTLIWQIDKEDGYNGDTLDMQLWSNINYGGKPIRNLRPVKGGSQLYGPNMYFLSNRNFDAVNDTVFIVEVTDTMGGNDTVLVNMRITDTPYGFPPNALQYFNYRLATNDCRFLSAFIENDKIQFAGNTTNFDTTGGGAKASLYHGVVDMNNNMSVTGTIITDSLLGFGYPNLAYTGNGPAEDDFILVFNYSSYDSFAGMKAIYYDGTDYSEPTVVHAGESHITIPGFGQTLRWGDYTGCQRVYNDPGRVWFSGLWGGLGRRYATWIAELGKPGIVSAEPAQPVPALEAKSYPNPVQNRVFVEFELPSAQNINISLYDIQGRIVHVFLQDKLKGGKNRFSFLTDDLPAGVYVLNIRNEGGILASKKIVKQ